MRKVKRLLTVQATEKTLDLLEILAAGSERISIGKLADQLHVSRNNALLLLVTLESRGMVRWDDDDKIYRPGCKSAELARQFLGLPGVKVAEPKVSTASRTSKACPAGARKLRSDRRLDVAGLAAGAP